MAPGSFATVLGSGGGAGPEAVLVLGAASSCCARLGGAHPEKVLPNLLVNTVFSFGPLEALGALGVAAG